MLTKCDAIVNSQNFQTVASVVGFVVEALCLLVSKSAGLSLACQGQQVDDAVICLGNGAMVICG